MIRDPLLKWKLLGITATLVLVAAVPAWLIRHRDDATPDAATRIGATFVGRDECRPCHEKEFKEWRGSDHDRAMAPANDVSVLGDFNDVTVTIEGTTSRLFRKAGRFMINTKGATGKLKDFEILYTFGVEPLQQYLIAFPGGRLQCLNLAWDNDKKEWFDVYPGDQIIQPGDWLHWTQGGQTWNTMCAECHSTNLVKGFEPDSKTYKTTWFEINVSCEACHGPGSEHVKWAKIQPMARPEVDSYALVVNTTDLDAHAEVELCAPCHSRRSELGDYDHNQKPMLDFLHPVLLNEGTYHPDGQILDEDYVWGSFTQSKMFMSDVRCSDCHNVHSGKHHREGNALCLDCHRASDYDTKEHHFHKKIHEGKPSDGALCVKCHMPEFTYMVIDERADHSIRIPRPDLTGALGTPNACSQIGCHDKETLDWAVDAFTKWYGQAKKPHFGTALAAGREGRPEARNDLVRLALDPLVPAIVRATALSLLSRYTGAEVARAFAMNLADDEGLVRHTAITHLQVLDAKQLVELAAPLLFDPLLAVRMEAAVKVADIPDQLLKRYQLEARKDGLDEYEKAMRHSLDLPHGGHNLGNLYSRLQQPAKAERYYRDSIAVDDLFFPAKVNLAILLNGSGRNLEAEKLLKEVVTTYPDRHEIAYTLGLLLAEMKKYREAAKYLAIAAEGMPNHPGARRNLRELQAYLAQGGQ